MIQNTKFDYCKFFGAYAEIYTLSDSNYNVFYVGCTLNGVRKRLMSHIAEAKKNSPNSNKRKNKIIRSLDYKVTIQTIAVEYVTGTCLKEAASKARLVESRWIQRYISSGFRLCNRVIGVPDIIDKDKWMKPKKAILSAA